MKWLVLVCLCWLPAAAVQEEAAKGEAQETVIQATYLFPGLAMQSFATGWPLEGCSELVGITAPEYESLQARVIGWEFVATDETYKFEVKVSGPRDIELVDKLAKIVYARYRAERLPELMATVEAHKLREAKQREALQQAAVQLQTLLEDGNTVVDRNLALKASAERAEALRTQLMEARIEHAMVEAQARFLKERGLMADVRVDEATGESTGRRLPNERIQELEEKLAAFQAKGYTSKHPAMKQVEAQLAVERSLSGVQPGERLLDLELQLVGLEEKMKVVGELMAEERAWSAKLLEAEDLGAVRVTVDDVAGTLHGTRDVLRKLEAELAILEKGEPKRLEAQ
ncbi:MAG: hypothetical protein AB1486_23165 [Planctomycetota bacterium]